MEPAPEAGLNLRERLLILAPIAIAVGVGMTGFMLGNAPPGYAVINALALLLAAVLILIPGQPRSGAMPLVVTIAAVVLLAATLWLGPVVEGVRRWIPLGPLQLHVGMLVIPALVAVLPLQRGSISLAATAICAAIICHQPDFGSALALFAGISLGTIGRPLAPAEHAMRLVATAGLVLTALRPDPLEEVRFVETAIGDGWAISPLLGAAMTAAVVAAIAMPPWLTVQGRNELTASGRATAGAMGGFLLAGLLAPFPQPLVGFGASPILGYGLALAVLRFSR